MSETITRIVTDESHAQNLKVSLENAGWTITLIKQPDGTFILVAIPPTDASSPPSQTGTAEAQAVATPPIDAPSLPSSTNGKTSIVISKRDMDALGRVAHSEVGGFSKYGTNVLSDAVAAVIDTIFNRVAHRSYPDSIETVINQPQQFSAINPLGTWEGLPLVTPRIADIIKKHITLRASGISSDIMGATHFLNPHWSSSNALKNWGNYLVKNAVAHYGNENDKNIHYHGFPPGGTLPGPYSITYNSKTAHFGGNGVANPATVSSSV